MMRAKMRVSGIKKRDEHYEELFFTAVGKNGSYPEDGSDENNSFARWTPSAELRMAITNPTLMGKFKIDQEFYLDFTEVGQ